MRWKAGIVVSLVVLALAGGMAINASLRTADRQIRATQLAACARGNALRRELNERGEAQRATVRAVWWLLVADALATPSGVARPRLLAARAHLRGASYERLPQVDCAAVVGVR